jgi:hypothetical protein
MEFWNDGITLPNHFASAMADPTDAVCTLWRMVLDVAVGVEEGVSWSC